MSAAAQTATDLIAALNGHIYLCYLILIMLNHAISSFKSFVADNVYIIVYFVTPFYFEYE